MTRFELCVSIPPDARFVATVAALATQVARQAGCDQSLAAGFGAAVDAALRGCVTVPDGGAAIEVKFRRTGGDIEAVLNCGDRSRVVRPVPMDV